VDDEGFDLFEFDQRSGEYPEQWLGRLTHTDTTGFGPRRCHARSKALARASEAVAQEEARRGADAGRLESDYQRLRAAWAAACPGARKRFRAEMAAGR
jgi:hypothetical protein